MAACSLANMKRVSALISTLQCQRYLVQKDIRDAEAAAVVDVASLNALQGRLAGIDHEIAEQNHTLLQLCENYSQLGKFSSLQNQQDLLLFSRLAMLQPQRNFYIASGIRNNARRGSNSARRATNARRAELQDSFEILYGEELEQQHRAFPWSCCFVLRGPSIRVASELERRQFKFNRRQCRIKEEEAKEGDEDARDPGDA